MDSNRKRWLVVAGVAGGLLALALIARLAMAWYEPWHETHRVRSMDDRQICLEEEDLESEYRSSEPWCFDRSLLDGTTAEPGDCLRLTLEHESARITAATQVPCP